MAKIPDAEGCDLWKRTNTLIKKTGGNDSILLHPVRFHLTLLRYSKTVDEIRTPHELQQLILSKMFVDKMEFYPVNPFKCKIDENSDWSLSARPSELFGKKQQDELDPESERKWWSTWFYKTLEVGNVLDCRVVEVLPLHGHRLRVLHKHGATRILENLYIELHLKTDKNEIEILQRELLPKEFVRVAVYHVKQVFEVYTVHVTVDLKKLPAAASFKPLPKLGRITQDDMPSYIFDDPDEERLPSYSHYLMSKPSFFNTKFYNELLGGCGIDPKAVCSYFPEYNVEPGDTESQIRQESIKEAKLGNCKVAANTALKHLGKQEYDEALKEVAKAMKMCPSDDLLMNKLYDIRSDIFSAKMKKEYNMKSLCDLETAFKSPSCDDAIKQKLFKKIFKVANSYLRDKNYKKAAEGLEYIVKHDENHRLASKALDHIKTKHPEVFLNLEEMSQIDLQEKKKELLTELKKMKIL